VETMNDRPVQYSQLFFIQNAIFAMFLGEEYYQIIIFFISIFSVFILAHIFSAKEKSLYKFLIPVFTLFYFSSGFFRLTARYKIEAITYLLILLMFYLFTRKKSIKSFYFFSFLVGITIALKQLYLTFLAFIPLYVFLKFKSLPLKKKIKHLFFSLCLVFLTAFPFYLVMKASTNFFLGVPSMRIPYLDDIKISLPNVEKTKFYYQSENFNENLRMINRSLARPSNSLFSIITSFTRRNTLTNFMPMAIYLLIFLLLTLYFRKKMKMEMIFCLALIVLAILSYEKVVHIWTYFVYANFIFDALFLGCLFLYFKEKLKTKKPIYLLMAALMLFSIPGAMNNNVNQSHNKLTVKKLKEARNYVDQSTFALSSRPYETGDYLNIKTIEAQQENFDYLTDPNKSWDRLYQSFLAKNPNEFLFYSQEMGINTVIEYKLIKRGGKFPDPVKFFKEKNLLKEIVNNESVSIYQINYEEND
ncbi:MAG: hypothetical protein PHO28_04540, partial [Candidatus Pacebacteria bacterium]|nr:hypothetical protein [Candidatus Paceibacterota bacterium]